MKKKILSSKRIKNFIGSSLLLFVILFSVMVGVSSIVQFLVFKQRNFVFVDILWVALVLIGVSIILNLFYRINRITLLAQVIITYLTLLVVIYSFGFLFGWFYFDNITFLLTSLALNLFGGIVLSVMLLIRRNLEMKDLNRELVHFKERSKK